MIMRSRSQKFGRMFKLVRFLFAGALFITYVRPSGAQAQSMYDPWAEPLNLSHSGVAVDPASVIDSEGVVHVVWQDGPGNYMYSRFAGDQWSAPKTTNLDLLFKLPIDQDRTDQSESAIYTGPNPLIITGPGQNIFAFWLSARHRLFTSRVKNSNFEHSVAWDPAGLITPDVASFAVTVDARGEWHLVFLRTPNDPQNSAGIYYTHSTNSGRNWPVPVLLYESSYLRTLGAGEANLSIATAGTEDTLRVYAAWDNRPRKQVFLAQSEDGGESWEQPALIAGPTPDSGLAGPFNIRVRADRQSVVLVWQSGQPEGTCTQAYQFSNNGGATWSKHQSMLEGLSECPLSNELMAASANNPRLPPRLYLLTETQSQVFLSAWNGLQWSEPQMQPILSGFEDPETYREVIYGCQRASLFGERLYIVGCDQGRGGDVWVTSRDLGAIASWFTAPVWSPPAPVADDAFKMKAVQLVATGDGLIHAVFGQPEDSAIYYAYLDGELWSRITRVLQLPDGGAGSPAVAAGPGNVLFLVAASTRGTLYFSRATSGNASSESQWSTPERLGNVHDGEIGSADIALDSAGTVYVAYSVPVNEQRGIYLVKSEDYGTSWSEPRQVFSGISAGWDIVGEPSLLVAPDGVLHLTWSQQSIQGDGVPQPLSLYYARSQDGGNTFGNAEVAVDEAVGWQEIATDRKGNLHLIWQGQATKTTVWDQVSIDGGISWQFPKGLASEGGNAAAMADSAGQLHLMTASQGAVDHWLWDGSQWKAETPLRLSSASQQKAPLEALAASASKQGKMVVLMAVPANTEETGERTLLFATRTLKLPPVEVAIQDIPSAPPSPTFVAVTATPMPMLTPTAPAEYRIDNLHNEEGRVDTEGPLNLFLRALLPAALLLLSVLGIVIWRANRVRDE